MDINGTQIKSKADLKDIPTADLVTTYNSLTNRQIKKFENREKAVDRTWAVIKAVLDEPAEEKPAKAKKEKAPKPKKPFRFNFNFAPEDRIKPHRAGTKGRAAAIEALKKGATFEEVKTATGWNDKQAYEGIRLLHFVLGWGMRHDLETGKIYLVEKS